MRLEILANAKHGIIACFTWVFRVRKTKIVFKHFAMHVVIIGLVVIVIKIMAISHQMNRHWIKSLKFPMHSLDHLQIIRSVVFCFIYGSRYSTYTPKIIWISNFPWFSLLEFERLALPLRFLFSVRWIKLLFLLILCLKNILHLDQIPLMAVFLKKKLFLHSVHYIGTVTSFPPTTSIHCFVITSKYCFGLYIATVLIIDEDVLF